MTLKEVAARHHISIVRAKQIVDKTLNKIKSVVMFDRY
jgi:DNA-directed RNA polymerase sigma subunit (sigma70/sigma32)